MGQVPLIPGAAVSCLFPAGRSHAKDLRLTLTAILSPQRATCRPLCPCNGGRVALGSKAHLPRNPPEGEHKMQPPLQLSALLSFSARTRCSVRNWLRLSLQGVRRQRQWVCCKAQDAEGQRLSSSDGAGEHASKFSFQVPPCCAACGGRGAGLSPGCWLMACHLAQSVTEIWRCCTYCATGLLRCWPLADFQGTQLSLVADALALFCLSLHEYFASLDVLLSCSSAVTCHWTAQALGELVLHYGVLPVLLPHFPS